MLLLLLLLPLLLLLEDDDDDVSSSIAEGTGEARVAIVLVAPTVAAMVRTVVASLPPSLPEGTKSDGMLAVGLLLLLLSVAQQLLSVVAVAVELFFIAASNNCFGVDNGALLSPPLVCAFPSSGLVFSLYAFIAVVGNDATDDAAEPAVIG